MPRIRTMKPDFFQHDGIYTAEQQYGLPLRIAFLGLITCCDREGRFRWRPNQLKLNILPYDNVDMTKVLDALAASGFIIKYKVNDAYYGCIPSWHKHQHVNLREHDSEIPDVKESVVVLSKDLTLAQQVTSENIPHSGDLFEDVPVNDTSGTCQTSTLAHACMCAPVGKGKEGNGNGKEEEGKEHSVAPARPESVLSEITQIFEHWKSVMGHPNAQLDEKRKSLIRHALKSGYSGEQLRQAISGCAATPHNMGDNDRGQRYDGLHVILRNADQIDRFINNFHQPPRPITAADKLTQNNLRAVQEWLNEETQKHATH